MDWITTRQALTCFETEGVPADKGCRVLLKALADDRLKSQGFYRAHSDRGGSAEAGHEKRDRVFLSALTWSWFPALGVAGRWQRANRSGGHAFISVDWREGAFAIQANWAFLVRRHQALSRANRVRLDAVLRSTHAEDIGIEQLADPGVWERIAIDGVLLDRHCVDDLLRESVDLNEDGSRSGQEQPEPTVKARRRAGRARSYPRDPIKEAAEAQLRKSNWSPPESGAIAYVKQVMEALLDEDPAIRTQFNRAIPGDTWLDDRAREVVRAWR